MKMVLIASLSLLASGAAMGDHHHDPRQERGRHQQDERRPEMREHTTVHQETQRQERMQVITQELDRAKNFYNGDQIRLTFDPAIELRRLVIVSRGERHATLTVSCDGETIGVEHYRGEHHPHRRAFSVHRHRPVRNCFFQFGQVDPTVYQMEIHHTGAVEVRTEHHVRHVPIPVPVPKEQFSERVNAVAPHLNRLYQAFAHEEMGEAFAVAMQVLSDTQSTTRAVGKVSRYPDMSKLISDKVDVFLTHFACPEFVRALGVIEYRYYFHDGGVAGSAERLRDELYTLMYARMNQPAACPASTLRWYEEAFKPWARRNVRSPRYFDQFTPGYPSMDLNSNSGRGPVPSEMAPSVSSQNTDQDWESWGRIEQ